MKILSAVPRQLTDTAEKLEWIDQACEVNRPDLFVTPQEFFGGVVMMPHKLSFTQDELLPSLKRIIRRHKCAMVVGVLENEGPVNREAIWFINENGEYQGRVLKFALPKYDHINTNGGGNVEPETDFDARFKVFTLQGMAVTGMFCWEAYSDILWTGLGILKPDLVCSMIKFGVNAWPVVRRDPRTKLNIVKDFGYGTWAEDGKWIERLHVANLWQVKCPIVCATNSWNLRPISMPLCGLISGIPGQATQSLWHPTKDDKLKEIPEKIVVDDVNPDAVRGALQNKFQYKDAVGDFPPYDLARFTMMLKINRIENRILSGRERKMVESTKDGRGVVANGQGFGLI